MGEVGDSKRMIRGKNVRKSSDLNTIIDDINMQPSIIKQNVNVYLEDERAKDFLNFLLSKHLSYNFENYFNVIDVNLGWTNYVQLHQKNVPEFLNSMIILDNDVKNKADRDRLNYLNTKAANILFLPDDVEKGIFSLLKDPIRYAEFEETIPDIRMPYEICFKDWVENSYESVEYKNWLSYVEDILEGTDKLFEFWLIHNEDNAYKFVEEFVDAYNLIADKLGYDYMMGFANSEDIE